MTQEDLYILLMQQTLDNDYQHLARMRRRLNTLEEEIHEKEKLITKTALELEGFRGEMLKRRTQTSDFVRWSL